MTIVEMTIGNDGVGSDLVSKMQNKSSEIPKVIHTFCVTPIVRCKDNNFLIYNYKFNFKKRFVNGLSEYLLIEK